MIMGIYVSPYILIGLVKILPAWFADVFNNVLF